MSDEKPTPIEPEQDEQSTGNHKPPGSPDAGGADRFGGTRAGTPRNFTGVQNLRAPVL